MDKHSGLCVCSVTQSCLTTLCDLVDCSPPGSSFRGILQARILEWVAISFYKGSFWPRDWTCIGSWISHHTTWEALDTQVASAFTGEQEDGKLPVWAISTEGPLMIVKYYKPKKKVSLMTKADMFFKQT